MKSAKFALTEWSFIILFVLSFAAISTMLFLLSNQVEQDCADLCHSLDASTHRMMGCVCIRDSEVVYPR